MSRTSDSNTTGIQAFENTDAASGPSISNIQRTVNENTSLYSSGVVVNGGGQIDIDERYKVHVVLVNGNSGDITTSSTPFNPTGGGSFRDGTEITVIGTNQAEKVTIPNTAKADDVTISNGNVELGEDFLVTYIRVTSGGFSYWLEKGRNS